jgi:hypothetical protein
MAPSTERTRPAPRDIQTENVRVFSPASLGSSCCNFLPTISIYKGTSETKAYSPSQREEADVEAVEEDVEQQFGPLSLRLEFGPETHVDGAFCTIFLTPQQLSVDQRRYGREDAVVNL